MSRQYEMIREIFNSCSGNQMRDVHFEEVETEDRKPMSARNFRSRGCSAQWKKPPTAAWCFIWSPTACGKKCRLRSFRHLKEEAPP